MKKSPLDPIINKFAEMGYDAEGAFDMLDEDGDGVLTKKEIEDGMKLNRIVLTEKEWEDFM